MSEFSNVTVSREANVYFDGKVTSRKIAFASGDYKTLGIMMPGDYHFGTDHAELMEIAAGELSYCLQGSNEWHDISTGGSFRVPANSSFDVKIKSLVDYCCSYLD